MDLKLTGKAPPIELVRQSEASECGLACLAMIAGHHGHRIDLPALRRRFPISLKGTSLKAMISVADRLGLSARPLRIEMEDFERLAYPVVAHWDLRHFVVIAGMRRTRRGCVFDVLDPAGGACELPAADVARRFTGVVLEFSPTIAFQPKREPTRLHVRQLWSGMSGLPAAAVQLLVLSIGLQLIALAMPLLMQTAVDTVLPSYDWDLLLVLALGFGGVVLIRAASEAVRGYVLLNLGNTLGYQIVVNLFRHLMRLPLPWFEKRHTGDIVSRFGSTQPLTNLLTSGVLGGVIDGLLAVVTLALMMVYSVTLSLLAIAAVVALVTAQLVYFQMLKSLNANAISAQAAEQSSFIESVRGVAAVKAFGLESWRQRVWQNKKVEAVNAGLEVARLSNRLAAVKTMILGLETVLFVYLALRLALRAELTIGMIFAFQAYKQQFVDAGTRLVQTYTDFRLLDVHLLRISDIALTRPEQEDRAAIEQPPIRGALSLRGVRFSYGVGEPDVLRGVEIEVERGETLALVGPSGGGKTTLMKIMMGLLTPTTGEVLVDGQRLAAYGRQEYRQQVGSVAQDDSLFAGSIAENIAFFDPDIDMERVREAAEQAAIHRDIIAMPMQYESLVGDMGSSLSGGQKQRVLLARALYRRPAILFLDEGTAHLDARTEALVNDAVKQLDITRIIVAHRRETIATADRILRVAQGRVAAPDQRPAGMPGVRNIVTGGAARRPLRAANLAVEPEARA
jgi:ATP-binding cassette subfamily B protein RaxB